MSNFGDIARKIMKKRSTTQEEVASKIEQEIGADEAVLALNLLDKPDGYSPQRLGALVRAITSGVEEQNELLLAYVTPEDCASRV